MKQYKIKELLEVQQKTKGIHLTITNSVSSMAFTWRVTGLMSSLLSLVISIPCLRASLSGPMEASFTKFFISEPEYPGIGRGMNGGKEKKKRKEMEGRRENHFRSAMLIYDLKASVIQVNKVSRTNTFSQLAYYVCVFL